MTQLTPQDIILILLKKASEKSLKLGRTKIQKIIFLLQKKLGDKLGYKFIFTPYHYGPFSFTLAETLEELKDYKWVNVNEENPFEGYTEFNYTLNRNGNHIADKVEKKNPELSKEIDKFLTKLLNEKFLESALLISKAAKAIHILSLRNEPITVENLKTKISEQWPDTNIEHKEMSKIISGLENLGFIKKKSK